MTVLPQEQRDVEGTEDSHSIRALLGIYPFRYLWLAQVLSQTAQNGVHYVELLMIARLTNSNGHVGLMILAFTLPAVLFSAVAGVVVDRLPKRRILLGTNLLRVLLALSYILALNFFSGRFLLLWVYSATFMTSAIAQFFAPAQGATIPMLVGRRRLITANSLFNLTLTASQVLGLLVIFPFIIKLGDYWLGRGNGIEFSFGLVAIVYLTAAALVDRLPADPPRRAGIPQEIGEVAGGALRRSWQELKDGLAFIRRTPVLWVPMINLSVTATIAMILVMVAPIFAKEILGVSQEDAIYIFAPAGIGMFIGVFTLARLGNAFRREFLSNTGLFLQGTALMLLALLAMMWEGSTQMTLVTMTLALGIGLGFAFIGIPAQTLLQERTPHEVRGRAFSVQFLLANALSIPPMLFAGTVADRIGIPPVIFFVGLALLLLGSGATWWVIRCPDDSPILDELGNLPQDTK